MISSGVRFRQVEPLVHLDVGTQQHTSRLKGEEVVQYVLLAEDLR